MSAPMPAQTGAAVRTERARPPADPINHRSKWEMEVASHAETASKLSIALKQLEIAQAHLADLSAEPFAAISVNVDLQKALTDLKLSNDRVEARAAQLEAALAEQAAAAEEARQEARMAKADAESARRVADEWRQQREDAVNQLAACRGEVGRLEAVVRSGDHLATIARTQKEAEAETVAVDPAISCPNCRLLIKVNETDRQADLDRIQTLKAEISRLECSAEFFESIQRQTHQQLKDERDAHLSTARSTADLQHRLVILRGDHEAAQSRMRSYMRLSEDRQRLLLAHAESVQEFAYKRVKDASELARVSTWVVESAANSVRDAISLVWLSIPSADGEGHAEAVNSLFGSVSDRLDSWVREMEMHRVSEKTVDEHVEEQSALARSNASIGGLDRRKPSSSATLLVELRKRMGLYPSAVHGGLSPAVRSSNESIAASSSNLRPSTERKKDTFWAGVTTALSSLTATISGEVESEGLAPLSRMLLKQEEEIRSLRKELSSAQSNGLYVPSTNDAFVPAAVVQSRLRDVLSAASSDHDFSELGIHELFDAVTLQVSTQSDLLRTLSALQPKDAAAVEAAGRQSLPDETDPKEARELLMREVEELRAVISGLEDSLFDQQQREERLLAAVEIAQNDRDAEIEAAHGWARELEAKLEAIERELQDVLEDRSQLVLELKTLKSALEVGNRGNDGESVLEKSVKVLESELSRAAADVEYLQAELHHREDLIKRLDEKATNYQQEIEVLSRQLAQQANLNASEISESQRENAAQMRSVLHHNNLLNLDLEAAQMHIKALRQSIDEASRLEKELVADLESTRGAMHARNETIRSMEESLRSALSERDSAAALVVALREELAEEVTRNSHQGNLHAKEMEEHMAKATSLQRDLDAASARCDQYWAEAEELRHSVDRGAEFLARVGALIEVADVTEANCVEGLRSITANTKIVKTERDALKTRLNEVENGRIDGVVSLQRQQDEIAALTHERDEIHSRLEAVQRKLSAQGDQAQGDQAKGVELERNTKAPGERLKQLLTSGVQTLSNKTVDAGVSTTFPSGLIKSTQTESYGEQTYGISSSSTVPMVDNASAKLLASTLAELSLAKGRIAGLEEEISRLDVKAGKLEVVEESMKRAADNQARTAQAILQSIQELDYLRTHSQAALLQSNLETLTRLAETHSRASASTATAIARLESKLRRTAAEVDALKKERDSLQESLIGKDAVVATLREDGAAWKGAAERAAQAATVRGSDGEKIASLEGTARKLESELATTRRDLSAALRAKESAEARVELLKAEVAKSEAELESSVKRREERMSEVMAALAKAKGEAAEMKEKLKESKRTARLEVEKLEAEVRRVKDELVVRISSLSQQATEEQRRAEKTTRDMAGLRDTIAAKDRLLKELDAELARIEAASEHERIDFKRRILDAEASRDEIARAIEAERRRWTDREVALQRQLERLDAVIAAKDKDFEEARDRYERERADAAKAAASAGSGAAAAAAAAASREIEGLRGERLVLEAKLRDAESALRMATAVVDAKESELEELTRSMNAVLANERQRADMASHELEQERSRRENLEIEVQSLRERLRIEATDARATALQAQTELSSAFAAERRLLQDRVAGIETELKNAKARLASLAKELEAEREQARELGARYRTEMEAWEELVRRSAAERDTALQRAELLAAEAVARGAATQAEVVDAKVRASEAERRVDDLVQEAQREVESARAEARRANVQRESAVRSLEQMQRNVERLEREMEAERRVRATLASPTRTAVDPLLPSQAPRAVSNDVASIPPSMSFSKGTQCTRIIAIDAAAQTDADISAERKSEARRRSTDLPPSIRSTAHTSVQVDLTTPKPLPLPRPLTIDRGVDAPRSSVKDFSQTTDFPRTPVREVASMTEGDANDLPGVGGTLHADALEAGMENGDEFVVERRTEYIYVEESLPGRIYSYGHAASLAEREEMERITRELEQVQEMAAQSRARTMETLDLYYTHQQSRNGPPGRFPLDTATAPRSGYPGYITEIEDGSSDGRSWRQTSPTRGMSKWGAQDDRAYDVEVDDGLVADEDDDDLSVEEIKATTAASLARTAEVIKEVSSASNSYRRWA
ncbi:hypothetical protein DFJ73DRAFT_821894 [Zopfochytrium polystomum]|nr:hypothetical protein DFJ73DRAFT_821894 [Zopfochytrium polystomum]